AGNRAVLRLLLVLEEPPGVELVQRPAQRVIQFGLRREVLARLDLLLEIAVAAAETAHRPGLQRRTVFLLYPTRPVFSSATPKTRCINFCAFSGCAILAVMSDWIQQAKVRGFAAPLRILLDVLEPLGPLGAQVLYV